jgi:hypothetical protein
VASRLVIRRFGNSIMADIASELAGNCGVSAEAAQEGLGVVPELLKRKLPAESFAKVSAAVPGADDMMAAAGDTSEQAPGGVVGAVKGASGKIFGGGTGALPAQFGQLGLTADQIQGFLSKVLEYLKGKLPEIVMSQSSGSLPSPHEAAH